MTLGSTAAPILPLLSQATENGLGRERGGGGGMWYFAIALPSALWLPNWLVPSSFPLPWLLKAGERAPPREPSSPGSSGAKEAFSTVAWPASSTKYHQTWLAVDIRAVLPYTHSLYHACHALPQSQVLFLGFLQGLGEAVTSSTISCSLID